MQEGGWTHLIEAQLEGVALLSALLGADGGAIDIHEHKAAVVCHQHTPL